MGFAELWAAGSKFLSSVTDRRANWPSLRTTCHIPFGKIRPMNSAQLAEVSAAPANVVDMSKMIQVRHVPDELHRALKMRSVEEGMTLSDFIKRELEVLATGLSKLEEANARVKARGSSGLRTETIVNLIREGRGE